MATATALRDVVDMDDGNLQMTTKRTCPGRPLPMTMATADLLPAFRLGSLSAHLYRNFSLLLVKTFEMVKQNAQQQHLRPLETGNSYCGTLHDRYEEAMIELVTRCHAEGQLGYLVAVLVDDAKNSHFLHDHTDGYQPLASLRLWGRLDELWGRPFSSSTPKKTAVAADAKDKSKGNGSAADTTSSATAPVNPIRQGRKNTLLRCILTESDGDGNDDATTTVEDDDDDDATALDIDGDDEASGRATGLGNLMLQGSTRHPTKGGLAPTIRAAALTLPSTEIASSTFGKAVTNTRRTHFCVNCAAHTEGWPCAWKAFDPLLRVIWCRSCYTPHIITRHALLKHYRVSEDALNKLPSVYSHSRASTSMLCYLFDQVFAQTPLVSRLRAARPRLIVPAKTLTKGAAAAAATTTTTTRLPPPPLPTKRAAPMDDAISHDNDDDDGLDNNASIATTAAAVDTLPVPLKKRPQAKRQKPKHQPQVDNADNLLV